MSKKKATAKKSTRRKEPGRVCATCCHVSGPRATKCAECGGTKFAPRFVRQLRKVTRQTYVQVTEARPEKGKKSGAERITLYKWWPSTVRSPGAGGGNTQSFNINTAEHWDLIKRIVDEELAPYLGWKSRKELTADIEQRVKDERTSERQVKALAQQDPGFMLKVLKALKLDKVAEDDYEQLANALSEIAAIYLNADEGLRRSIRRLVKKLPSQGARAVSELSDLMEALTLSQITAVTSEVRRRMGLLQLFRERVLDDTTYEITGDGSIHRLLEQAMWIVDESYWLMHSNRQLRTIVGREFARKDKRFEKKRPDFVCGDVGGRLIVIEIKRPSHTLDIPDLNQLEEYVRVCLSHDPGLSTYRAMLVGQKIARGLEQTVKQKLRSGNFQVRTYSQLIRDSERRYKEYLDALEG